MSDLLLLMQMTALKFTATLFSIADWTIARLPDDISKQLPSRGQVAVVGTINEHQFRAVLEPDGNWGHWLHVTEQLQNVTQAGAGDTIKVQIEVTKDWPEPTIPADFDTALQNASDKVKDKWQDITPMARWEWVRWINATGNTDTRAIRIEKSISKLEGKHRRPCCFNLAACTVPEISKNGVLRDPAAA